MNLENKFDKVDVQILRLLQENARFSYAEIGRRVGLSPPAAAERIHRMENAGLIEGYHARVNPAKAGVPVIAFTRVSVPVRQYPKFTALVKNLPEVMECHHVTGAEAFILKVTVTSMAHLETLVAQFSRYGQTATSVVMSTPVDRQICTQP